MTKLKIELTKSDVQKIVLEHITQEYNLRKNERPGRVYDGVSITWTEDGGLIFERDGTPKTQTSKFGDPNWEALVDDNGKHL